MSDGIVEQLPVDQIDLDLIDIGKRLREVDDASVDTLVASMVEKGQLTPIEIRPAASGRYLVTIGAHRVAAARKIGWSKIGAQINPCSEDEALAREIDENLYRKELTNLDKPRFVTEKLDQYTYSGGKFRRGRDLRKEDNLSPLDANASKAEQIRFLDQVKAQFGIHPRTAKRLIRRGRNISPTLWQVIRTSKKAIPNSLLDKLASLPPEDRNRVEQLVVNEGVQLSEAVKSLSQTTRSNNRSAEAEARRVAPLWASWTAKERAVFLKIMKEPNP